MITMSSLTPDFLIIARTDAFGCTGLADVIRRGRSYIEAGADMIFAVMLQNPHIVDEIKRSSERMINYFENVAWLELEKEKADNIIYNQ